MKPILFRVKEEIINNINYRLDNDNLTAEVSEKSGGYEGAIVIPETVVFNDVTYRVTTIGEWAFCDCKSLTSIIIPNSVMTIGARALEGCSSLTSITIPNSVTSIKAWAFAGCTSLISIAIPNSVTSIGQGAFDICSSLTTIVIPDSVMTIGEGLFFCCSSLTSITLPNSMKTIGEMAFYDCSSLTSITIPNSVTSIGDRAFSYCSSLTSVTIPNSVTSIKNNAFYNCTSLTSVTIEAETPPVLSSFDVFYQTNNCPIYVPCNAVNTYKTAEEWSRYADRIRGNCASYTIKFKNWDGSVLLSKQVEEGQMPQYTGTTPTKPDDAQYTYTFSGWTPQIVAATADATYTATYTDTPRNQGIENVQGNEVQSTKVIKDGQVLILRNGKTYTMQGQEVK